MATVTETQLLALHWNQVIKEIYPLIEVVVIGDDNTVDSMLSTWNEGDPTKRRPTESELLNALAIVTARNADAATMRAAILSDVGVSVGKSTAIILLDNNAKGNLLMALLLAAGAIANDGTLRPHSEWIEL